MCAFFQVISKHRWKNIDFRELEKYLIKEDANHLSCQLESWQGGDHSEFKARVYNIVSCKSNELVRHGMK